MKNRKGFTLTEILVVIAIIGIILLVAIPSILAISKSIKRRELEAKKEALISAAEIYAKNNESLFGDNTVIIIPVRTLVYYGYVTKEENQYKNAVCNEPIGCVINPVDNTSMNDELITIKRKKSITIATWGEEEVNGYVVYFDGNGAVIDYTKARCQTTGVSCSVTTPPIHRTGYTILGFSSLGSSSQVEEVGAKERITINSSSRTYYAVTKRDVTVTFNANGGSITSGSSTANCSIYNTETSCAVSEPTCTRSNYVHNGWNTASNGSGTQVDATRITNSLTAYALWISNVFKVTLDNRSATTAGTSEIYVKYNTGWYSNSGATTSISSITKPTKTGYTFGGYYTETGGGGTQIINSSGTILSDKTTTFTANTTLYAKWTANTYTITLDNRSATTAGTDKVYVKYNTGWYSNLGATTSISSITKPTKTGHLFGGYYTQTSGGGTQIIKSSGTILSGKTTTFTANTSIYANWTACGKGTFAAAGATSCTACVIGSYNASTGSGTCTACANGNTTSSSGTQAASSCTACSNAAHVATWETQTWKSDNTVDNLCKIKTCDSGYKLSNNTCVLDRIDPSCTLTADANGVKWNTKTNAVSYVINKSSTKPTSYSNNTSVALSASTFYGHVKSSTGHTSSCSITLTNATKDYTCSSGGSYNTSSSKCEYDALVKEYVCSSANVTTNYNCVCLNDQGTEIGVGIHSSYNACNTECKTYGWTVSKCTPIYSCSGDGIYDNGFCKVWVENNKCPSGYVNPVPFAYKCSSDSHTLNGTTCSYSTTSYTYSCSSGTVVGAYCKP